jgi:hypothetical protein
MAGNGSIFGFSGSVGDGNHCIAEPRRPTSSVVLGVSERLACRVTGQHRATQRHEPAAATPADPDAALRDWLRAYAKDFRAEASGRPIMTPALKAGQ